MLPDIQQVKIIKGIHRGRFALIVETQKEETGEGKLYKLQDRRGKQLYNGSFTWFPESFVKNYPTHD